MTSQQSTDEYQGRVVLVTGGTQGVGHGIAESFLAAGAQVVVCGRNGPESLPEHLGRRAEFVACDVREIDAVQALVAGIVQRHGRLDVLINNAGGAPPAEAATASPRFHESIVRLNLLAPLNLAQAANAVMQIQPEGGVVLFIGSVSALRPSPGTAAYGAAKAGVLSLVSSLAVEWAPKVRVVAVSPGLVHTEKSHLHYGDEQGLAAVSATVPAGRLASPQDVAEACLFMASPRAAYVNGTHLLVHGGGEKPAFLDAAHVGHDKQAPAMTPAQAPAAPNKAKLPLIVCALVAAGLGIAFALGLTRTTTPQPVASEVAMLKNLAPMTVVGSWEHLFRAR